jgi:glycosyltransferase involved in cell wall biosynthesis
VQSPPVPTSVPQPLATVVYGAGALARRLGAALLQCTSGSVIIIRTFVKSQSLIVIVPAFNEGRVVRETVGQLLAAGLRVVVVDDGSHDETPDVLRGLNIDYIRHPVNLGQGAALRTGMAHALRMDADIAVHFDADGQHDCDQISQLIAPILAGTADVVFGSRFLRKEDTARVPLKKRIVLWGGILVSWMFTGVRLSDTHNGFRALSRKALERIQLQENGFAHATEILQRVRDAGLRYVEVPITINYTEYSQRKGQKISGSVGILFDLILAKLTNRSCANR